MQLAYSSIENIYKNAQTIEINLLFEHLCNIFILNGHYGHYILLQMINIVRQAQ